MFFLSKLANLLSKKVLKLYNSQFSYKKKMLYDILHNNII